MALGTAFVWCLDCLGAINKAWPIWERQELIYAAGLIVCVLFVTVSCAWSESGSDFLGSKPGYLVLQFFSSDLSGSNGFRMGSEILACTSCLKPVSDNYPYRYELYGMPACGGALVDNVGSPRAFGLSWSYSFRFFMLCRDKWLLFLLTGLYRYGSCRDETRQDKSECMILKNLDFSGKSAFAEWGTMWRSWWSRMHWEYLLR